jgi:hypothetical protein
VISGSALPLSRSIKAIERPCAARVSTKVWGRTVGTTLQARRRALGGGLRAPAAKSCGPRGPTASGGGARAARGARCAGLQAPAAKSCGPRGPTLHAAGARAAGGTRYGSCGRRPRRAAAHVGPRFTRRGRELLAGAGAMRWRGSRAGVSSHLGHHGSLRPDRSKLSSDPAPLTSARRSGGPRGPHASGAKARAAGGAGVAGAGREELRPTWAHASSDGGASCWWARAR